MLMDLPEARPTPAPSSPDPDDDAPAPLQWVMAAALFVPVFPLVFAAILVWAMPCPTLTRLLNGCASGQVPAALMLIVIVAGYAAPAVLAMTLTSEEDSVIRFTPLLIASAGLILTIGVWSWLLQLTRDDPAMQPTAITVLREHAQTDLDIGVRTIDPIRVDHQVSGFHVTLAITSTLGGGVTVHAPEGLSATLPPLVAYDPNTGQPPVAQQLALEPGRMATAEFWLRPTSPYRAIRDSVCSWGIRWAVDRIPAYPLYLLGIGSVAEASPFGGPSTTHSVPTLRTTALPCPDLLMTAATH